MLCKVLKSLNMTSFLKSQESHRNIRGNVEALYERLKLQNQKVIRTPTRSSLSSGTIENLLLRGQEPIIRNVKCLWLPFSQQLLRFWIKMDKNLSYGSTSCWVIVMPSSQQLWNIFGPFSPILHGFLKHVWTLDAFFTYIWHC